jgi:hypothetical protein
MYRICFVVYLSEFRVSRNGGKPQESRERRADAPRSPGRAAMPPPAGVRPASMPGERPASAGWCQRAERNRLAHHPGTHPPPTTHHPAPGTRHPGTPAIHRFAAHCGYGPRRAFHPGVCWRRFHRGADAPRSPGRAAMPPSAGVGAASAARRTASVSWLVSACRAQPTCPPPRHPPPGTPAIQRFAGHHGLRAHCGYEPRRAFHPGVCWRRFHRGADAPRSPGRAAMPPSAGVGAASAARRTASVSWLVSACRAQLTCPPPRHPPPGTPAIQRFAGHHGLRAHCG